jgi:hypothetical protein
MRVRSLAKAVLVAGLVVSGLTPAHAGPYATRAYVARIAYAEVTLGVNGYGAAILEQIDGLDADGRFSGIPTAEANPTSYVGTPEGDVGAGNSRFLGCIMVVTSKGNDGSCADFGTGKDPQNPKFLRQSCARDEGSGCVRSPSTLTFDPALRDGTVTFSVESKIAGFEITANLKLTQDGNPAPLIAGATNVSPIPPNAPPGPQWLTSGEARGVVQTAKVALGTMRSDILPGAPANISATKRAGMVISLNELTTADLMDLLCTQPNPGPLGILLKPSTCYL